MLPNTSPPADGHPPTHPGLRQALWVGAFLVGAGFSVFQVDERLAKVESTVSNLKEDVAAIRQAVAPPPPSPQKHARAELQDAGHQEHP